MKPTNSVSIGSSDLGTPDEAGSSYESAGMLKSSEPDKDPVEYISTGGPKTVGKDHLSSDVPMPDKSTMHAAMMRRLTHFFTKM